jgi:hypothetical protein
MRKLTLITLLFIVLVLLSSCKDKVPQLSSEEVQTYKKIGDNTVQTAFSTLLGQVKGQLKKGGVDEAIPYCKENASSIMKVISKEYHVKIKRTTNKLRNPDNHPNARESEILNQYLKLSDQMKEPTTIVERGEDGKIHYYAPIKIQKKCLLCHGEQGTSLNQVADSIIKKLYPKDMATGYKEGDLRGIWSITFEK